MSLKTQKLYWDAPFQFEGDAKLIEAISWKGQPALVLDRSLFYPEGGGQKGDRGEVIVGGQTRNVIDTQIDEAGRIFIVLGQALSNPRVGSTLSCRVDEDWRRRQMSQHTGQHMLSRLLHDTYNAPTVSARLGETFFSLEVDSTTLSQEQLSAAEDALNKLILEDRPIRAWFPTPEELGTLELRKQPSVTEGIRVIQVEGFDVTPCGGTHCECTGQVGFVHIQSMERYKGMTRLFVSAGLDAAREFQRKERNLQAIQAIVDGNEQSVVKQVEALQLRCRQEQEEKKQYMERAADIEIRIALEKTESLTQVVLKNGSPEYARLISKGIVEKGKRISLVSCETDGEVLMVLDRGGKSQVDLGAVVKEVLKMHPGKGGGSAVHAEGRVAAAVVSVFIETLMTKLSVE